MRPVNYNHGLSLQQLKPAGPVSFFKSLKKSFITDFPALFTESLGNCYSGAGIANLIAAKQTYVQVLIGLKIKDYSVKVVAFYNCL
jgi:hypothetical protein